MRGLHIWTAVSSVVFCKCEMYLPDYSATARSQGKLDQTGDTMSAIDVNRIGTNPHSTGVFSRVLSLLTAWNDARVTRNSLSKLSDRELDDIGLCRGDIERVARGF